MSLESVHKEQGVTKVVVKARAFMQMLKFRLTFTVVFSSGMAYILGNSGRLEWASFLIFIAAGFLVTSSSNIINQIIEKDSDRLMKRTQNRPLPTGIISVNEAVLFAFITGVLGIYTFVNYININAGLLAFASLLLYAFAYTPMKTVHPIAVFVGAIPGALPPMIGWVAATNQFGWEPGILFAIQFIWQFPHFWAIAWVLDDDYKKAGIRLLPGTGKDVNTAFQIMIYTLVLIPLGFVPYLMGMTGLVSAVIALVCGVLFLMQTFYLMKVCTSNAAKQIMFGSFLYLPIVQIAFVLDKVVK